MIVQPIIVNNPIHHNNSSPLVQNSIKMMSAKRVPNLTLVDHLFKEALLINKWRQFGDFENSQVFSIIVRAILHWPI